MLPRESFPHNSLSNSSPGDLSAQPSPRDSEVPRIASQGFGKLPMTLVVFLLLLNGPLTSLLPRKGGYPQIASIRWIDDRPDLSDLGWSSHYDPHTTIGRTYPTSNGLLAMIPTLYDVALRIGRFPPLNPYLHISSCSHTLLLQSYINASNKSSLTTKISYIYHFPRGNTHIYNTISKNFIYI